ncbi:hypothetical protein MSAN_02179400 [Mycena sanguinolenta]|uniref:Uncharacterized protein n=1 Tax=Mycena sanguinolenta TaxID=230812 RepID=A0A8H6XFP3_9AGAR|nr:hypothetical protein MSAN_02179400 [Mycena sanguinolenta]
MPGSSAETQFECTRPAASTDKFRNSDLEEFETISNATEQIGRLELVHLEAIAEDATIHENISLASSRIFSFLDCVNQQSLPAEVAPQILAIFAKLFSVTFLATVFEQRKILHRIAAQSLADEPGPAAVICWVDAFLFKLGDTTITVASGVSLAPPFPGSAELRAEDGLRAASQLPSNWHSVARVIASDQASPAAKRLALRLTFAAFVLGPRLCSGSEQMPFEIVEVLERCISQTRAAGFSASRTASREHQKAEKRAQVRPHTLGCLLNILQNILHPDDSVACLQLVTPPEELDPAQTILLRWGDTVSWCWETWDDHRIANAESVVFLASCFTLQRPMNREHLEQTAMWLRHFESVRFLPVNIDYSLAVSTASSIALLRVLHYVVLSLSTLPLAAGPPSVPWELVSKACCFAAESMRHLLWNPKEDERWIVSGLCKCLLSLFVLLAPANDEELAVHDYILEALSLANADTLHICMAHVQEDDVLRFSARLNKRLVAVKNFVSESLEQTRPLNLIRTTLNLAVIVWFSGTHGCILRESVAPLLSNVVKILLQEGTPGLVSEILGDAILTASSAARKDPSFIDENRESLWQFAITSSSSELSIASSFAHYIITSEILCNSLYCAEAWTYFSEILLLILKHHYIEEQEPLALLICPTLCAALIRLLQADATSTQFMLSTPFTLNLCADLKSVCEGDGSGKYLAFMKERLNKIGFCLLDQIRNSLSQGATSETTLERSQIPMQLTFYRMYGGSHLVFIPEM